MQKLMYSTGYTTPTLPTSQVQTVYSRVNYNSPVSQNFLASTVSNQMQNNILINAQTIPRIADVVDTVYCPVCRMDFPQSKQEQHVNIHSRYTAFEVSAAGDAAWRKDLSATEASQNNPLSVVYPMVQPMEFWTKELADVQKKNTFKVVVNQKNKLNGGVVQLKNTEAQTNSRPPLQSQVKESDLYNCFDNAFNARTKFSVDDITTNNVGLATKRGLNEWEQMRLQK